jgi:hypothetical protein
VGTGFRLEGTDWLEPPGWWGYVEVQTYLGGMYLPYPPCPPLNTVLSNLYSSCFRQEHGVIATEEDPGPKAPCPCCTEDFPYKGMRDMHLKNCRRDLARARRLLAPGPEDVATVSRWLWEKPPAPLVHHPFGVQVRVIFSYFTLFILI